MNRLLQAGIGLGLSAGSVLMPQPAAAETPTSVEVNCSRAGPEIVTALRLGNIVCKFGEAIAGTGTNTPPRVTQGESVEDDSELNKWIWPVTIEAGIISMVGVAAYRVTKRNQSNAPTEKPLSDRDQQTVNLFMLDLEQFNMGDIMRAFDEVQSRHEKSKDEL